MPRIIMNQNTLTVQLNWLEAILSFQRSFEIPLSHVEHVRKETLSLKNAYKDVRHLGTHIPGFYAAGTYYKNDECIFWYVRRGQETIAIDLHDEKYDRLILGVDDASRIIRQFEQVKQTHKDPA